MTDATWRRGGLWVVLLAALTSGGCAQQTGQPGPSDPELAAYTRLMMPRKIEIQRYLTKPVSFARDGNPDGLEVILAAIDSFGDRTKLVGTLHFELYTLRMASGDRLGERLAFWPVEINSDETIVKHWDRLSRFYRFHLQLPSKPLKPGRYILTATLLYPGQDALASEYEFDQTTESAPGVTPSY